MNRKEFHNTSCSKAGIKIHPSDNDINQNSNTNKPSNLKAPVSFQSTTINSLDLELDNYSLDDLYHLFNIPNSTLSEESLKSAKQIVLKMHPDKSRLDSKYFLFFSKAYKRLFGIYEFQNKSLKKTYKDEEFFDDSNRNVLNKMFENNKDLKDSKNFNSWFNQSFEKHRLEDPLEQGYGDWLKSDEGFQNIDENVTKNNMNEIFEQKKKQIQAVSVYTGVNSMMSSSFGGSLLGGSSLGTNDNFTSDNYTDLRQAYTETLIPVTQEDYDKMQKFNNVSEYKAHREKVDVTPLTKEEGERQLYQQKTQMDQESAALAFKYAKESEKSKEKQNGFWSDIKHITGW
jgi:hypothetical protein